MAETVPGAGHETPVQALEALSAERALPAGIFVEVTPARMAVTWRPVKDDGVVVGEFHLVRSEPDRFIASGEFCA